MFLLTHEITNLISQAQDESLFVRRLETGADLLFHFLARLNCKGYKGVFSVNLAMVVRLNLFTGHFAARKICKNRPQRWSIFQGDGMVNVFFYATIAVNGFSMVLTKLDHHH